MDTQPSSQQTQSTKQPSHLPLAIISVILAGIIFGLLGYWFGNNVAPTQTVAIASPTTIATSTASPVAVASSTSAPTSTANWKTYTDSVTGMSFKYPDYAYIADSTSPKGGLANKIQLSVNVYPLAVSGCSDQPMGWDCANLEKDRAAIKKGDPTTPIAMGGHYKLITTPGIIGKQFTILSQLEVCNVGFSQTAVIYHGDNNNMGGEAIEITASGNVASIEKANPTYFSLDASMCGSLAWKQASDMAAMGDYYTNLVAGKTDAYSQQWFKTIDQIMPTVAFVK